MLKEALLTIAFSSFFLTIFSQPVENHFIDALINNKSNITDFIENDELERSARLGIHYTDVDYKCLISFDVPDEVKAGFKDGKFSYTLQTVQLEEGFSVVTLAIGSINYLQKFYFLNDKFVSPSRYFTRNWKDIESKYFIFKISEPKYFNDYCVKRLDDYVDSLCVLLDIEPEKQKLLEKEKIYYTFCIDENEVEKITGYKSKGMSVLAYDEVISAYQTHFHEVAHILINFKMQKLGLYTLPFFMEGFAVAVGGRGGMAPRVVTDLGYYLQKTGFLTYDSILTYESFYSQDANMTYAVSGLYNSFLLNELGGRKYIELYKSVNGDIKYVNQINPDGLSLPGYEVFNKFLGLRDNEKVMYVNEKDTMLPDNLFKGTGGMLEFADNYIKFFVKGRLFFGKEKDDEEFNLKYYVSKKFREIEKKDAVLVPMYCIIADSLSVHIYNLLNDELVYSYNKPLSILEIKFPRYSIYYSFFIKQALFDIDFRKGYYLRVLN